MKNFLLFTICLCLSLPLLAQESFDEYRQRMHQDFLRLKEKRTTEFENYRRKVNLEFSKYLAKRWEAMQAIKGEMPDMKPKPKNPPVVYKKPQHMDPIEAPVAGFIPIPEEPENPPIRIPELTDLQPEPDDLIGGDYFSFFVLGTQCTVSWSDDMKFQMSGNSEAEVSRVFELLSQSQYEYLLYDCARFVSDLRLNGWGIQMFCSSVAETLLGKGDEAVVLQTFLMTQFGYDARICLVGGKLKMMSPATVDVAAYSYITLNGKKYYIWDSSFRAGQSVYSYKENVKDATRAIDFENSASIKFEYIPTENRIVKSEKYPQMSVLVSVNKNLIDFYASMPLLLNDSWAMYAREPMEQEVDRSLLEQLTLALQGHSKTEATDMLLNFVQTGFEYKTDGDQFGKEKPFFKEEMFFYPYCDCEDRSFLYSYLVEKLVGLKTILVYAPDHVFVAVCFNDDVEGDFLMVDGKKYVICDPTYIGSDIGMCMPNYKNAHLEVLKM